MSRQGDYREGCTVYVGKLGRHASKSELEYAFGKYGPLKSVWVARNPPGFAFVKFEDPRDAKDAVRGLDGRRIGDCRRVCVEISTNRSERSPARRRREDGGGQRNRSRSPARRRRYKHSRSRSQSRSSSRAKSTSPPPPRNRR